MKSEYHGVYAALVTPYTSEGKVDYRELQKLVDYLICQGLEGFYVNGSTAEAFLLSEEERNSTIRAVVEANSGRAKVICHVGAISTEQAISFAKNAEKIVQYYQDIMSSTELPMFVYNFPNFSGFSLTAEVLEKLNRNKNLVGVKFTSSDMFLLEQIKTLHPELVVWNGFDEMLSAGLVMGADGGIGSTYNCMPKLAHKVYDAFEAGNLKEMHLYQARMNKVIKTICKYGVFASVKEILEMDGFAFHGVRKPFTPMTEEGRKELRRVYEEIIIPNR